MRKSWLTFALIAFMLVLGIGGGTWIFANGAKRTSNRCTPAPEGDIAACTVVKTDKPALPAPRPETEASRPTTQPQPTPLVNKTPSADIAGAETPPPAKPDLGADDKKAAPDQPGANDLPPEMKERLEELLGKLEDYTVTVSGTVVDDANVGVGGVNVFAGTSIKSNDKSKDKNGVSAMLGLLGGAAREAIATTDAAGNFSATFTRKVPENSTVTVVLNASGGTWLANGDVRKAAKSGENLTGVTVRVTPGASLKGRVTDKMGRGIANATVSLQAVREPNKRETREMKSEIDDLMGELERIRDYGGGGRRTGSVKTDANGEFAFIGVRPGKYVVNVAATGYSQAQDDRPQVELGAHRAEQIVSPIVLNAAATLKAVVVADDGARLYSVYADFRAPEAGATGKVSFTRSANMAKDGSYTFNDIPAGNYLVTVRYGGRTYLHSQAVSISAVEGQSVDLGQITLNKDPNAKPYPMRGGDKTLPGGGNGEPGWGLAPGAGGGNRK